MAIEITILNKCTSGTLRGELINRIWGRAVEQCIIGHARRGLAIAVAILAGQCVGVAIISKPVLATAFLLSEAIALTDGFDRQRPFAWGLNIWIGHSLGQFLFGRHAYYPRNVRRCDADPLAYSIPRSLVSMKPRRPRRQRYRLSLRALASSAAGSASGGDGAAQRLERDRRAIGFKLLQ